MIMKAMEAGAPMISVPAGVLKEFMTTNNSRTPTPPLSTASVTPVSNNANNAVKNKSRTPTPTPATTPTSTPTPADTPTPTPTDTPTPTPASTPTPTLTPLLSSSLPSSPVVPENSSVTITPSRKLESLLNSKSQSESVDSEESKDKMENKFDDKENEEDVSINVTEGLVNGSSAVGVKRPSTEEGGPGKPDLKKIRVFPRDLSVKVKEFSQDLDLTLKKQNQDGSTTPVQESFSSVRIHRDTSVTRPRDRFGQTDKDASNLKRVHRLTRKELESFVMRQFSEILLYKCELGHMKQLCEKLGTTLENNRKKTAQFHKEIEDLRKVTNRLTAEHEARKGQYVAPIRIKRSVGIQAAPHIINKGIMHANGSCSNIKTISPRSSNLVGVMTTTAGLSPGALPNGTLGIITTTQAGAGRGAVMSGAPGTSLVTPGANLSAAVRHGQGQIMMMAPTATGVQSISRPPQPGVNNAVVPVTQGRVVRAPVATIGTVMAPTGTLLSQRPILLQSDKVTSAIPPGGTAKSGGVIDLTDEDDGSRGTGRSALVPKPGTLVKVPASGTTQLVPIQQAGVGQVVLLNNTSGGQPTALIVSQVSTGVQSLGNMSSPAVAQARIGSSVMGTSAPDAAPREVPGAIVNTVTRTTASTIPQTKVQRHPAPLPRTPIQQVAGLSKKLPPQPTLKLSHRESSIVLSWTMAKTEDHESIASYQLYAYQEGTTPPSPGLWKKVGSVKALELPMACTLTQFMPGHVYHFAVRAVDIKSRLGPFSDPRSIRLDKK